MTSGERQSAMIYEPTKLHQLMRSQDAGTPSRKIIWICFQMRHDTHAGSTHMVFKNLNMAFRTMIGLCDLADYFLLGGSAPEEP